MPDILEALETDFPNTVQQRSRRFGLKDAYKTIAWVYSCVNLIADCISGVEFYFYKGGDGDKKSDRNVIVNPQDPILACFNSPIPGVLPTLSELIKLQFIYQGLFGESFITMEKKKKRYPTEIEIYTPLALGAKQKKDGKSLKHWKYVRATEQGLVEEYINPDKIIQWKYPNPYNRYRGMAPLTAARLSVEQDLNMATWNSGFFHGGVRNPIALMLKQRFTEPQRKDYLQALKSNFAGFIKGQLPLLVEGGMDVKVLQNTMKDLDFIEGKNLTREELCSVYNVPPAQVGIFRYANYCVTGDTLVTLSGGRTEKIINLKPGDKVLSMGDTAAEEKVVKNCWAAGVKDIYEIKTGSRTLKCSPEHKFFSLRSGVNPANPRRMEWVDASNLSVGDYVAVVTSSPEQHGTTTNTGEEATPELMHQLGLYVGDGSIIPSRNRKGERYETGLCFATPDTDPSKRDQVEEAIRVWKANVCLDKYTYRVCSVESAKRIRTLGFGGTSHTKRIPGWVYFLTSDLKKSFLSGFFSADGSYDKHGRVQIGLCNLDLVNDIRDLCLSVGYHVNNVCTRERDTNFGHQILYSIVVSFNSGTTKTFPNHTLQGGLAWERVRSISLLDPEDTFDLEIEGTHNYFANWMVTHNSNSKEQRVLLYNNNLRPKMMYYRDVFQTQVLDVYFPGYRCDFWWEEVDAFRVDPVEQARANFLTAQAAVKYYDMDYDQAQIAVILGKPELDPANQGKKPNPSTSSDDDTNNNQAATLVRGKKFHTVYADDPALSEYARLYRTGAQSYFTRRLNSFSRAFLDGIVSSLLQKGRRRKTLDEKFWVHSWNEGSGTVLSETFWCGVASAYAEKDNPNSGWSNGNGYAQRAASVEIPEEHEEKLYKTFAEVNESVSEAIGKLVAQINKGVSSVPAKDRERKLKEAVRVAKTRMSTARIIHKLYHLGRFQAMHLTNVVEHVWCASDEQHKDLHGVSVEMGLSFPGTLMMFPGESKSGGKNCTCTTFIGRISRGKVALTG